MSRFVFARAAASSLLALALAAASPRGPPWGVSAAAAEPVRISVAIKNRQVDPSQQTVRVTQGTALELTFSADERAELHLHGYDKTVLVEPGVPAVLRLEVKIAGRFSIEAHRFGAKAEAPGGRQRAHVGLLYLEVHPR